MNTLKTSLTLSALLMIPQVYAEVTSKTGNTSQTLVEAPVDAAVKTAVIYYYDGAEPEDNPPPYKFDGPWTFTWDSATPDKVNFEGTLNFGTHYTVTDAGMMGGVSEQYFYNFAHHVKGTANWSAGDRVLTFSIPIEDRDDGRASTVTFDKPPECKPPKHRACKAFSKTTPEYEGANINLTFSEDLGSFSGRVQMTEYGGSGFTKSETQVIIDIEGDLDDA